MKTLSFICTISSSLLLFITLISSAPDGSLITNIPGFSGSLPSNHHAGYVAIDGKPSGKKNLYYYFVTSERNLSTDPVVLWINSGPGCSSFIGFVYEHGPFTFQAADSNGSIPKLDLNPNSWSKVSNILYLDAPAGVGLSYSDDPQNYVTGDIQFGADMYDFLLKWFELYPEFQSNPFYIAGESYGGLNVPMLAEEVVKGVQGGKQPIINFKGYIIGNGVCDDYYDHNALVPFALGMGLITPDIYKHCKRACKGNFFDQSESCINAVDRVYEAISQLNPFHILEPCYRYPVKANTNVSSTTTLASQKHLTRMYGRRGSVLPADVLDAAHPVTNVHIYCINDDLAFAWLNDESVRKAINGVPASVAGLWTICSAKLNYTPQVESLLPHHKNLTSQGFRALLYSGDHDRVAPFTGTLAWTKSLGYKLVDEWRAWYLNRQVAGYLQAYENNLTVVTVKGGGHMAPMSKPAEALAFYSRWLDGKAI